MGVKRRGRRRWVGKRRRVRRKSIDNLEENINLEMLRQFLNTVHLPQIPLERGQTRTALTSGSTHIQSNVT